MVQADRSPTGVWLLAAGVGLPPALAIFDTLRPTLFERQLLRDLSQAQPGTESVFATTDLVLMSAAVTVLFATVVLAASRRRETLALAGLLVWSPFLALLGAETVLSWQSRPYVYPPGLRATFDPDPTIVGGITGTSRVLMNRQGMRGPDWPDGKAYRVLAVGGSTTICLILDDSEAWPQRLMDRMNQQPARIDRPVWVGNVGKSGRDSLHHLVLLKELPEASRVDLVLVLAGVNDLKQSVRLPRDTRVRLAPSRVFDLGGTKSPSAPFFKQTILYQAVKRTFGPVASNAAEVEDPRATAYAVRRRLRHSARKDHPLPDLAPLLADYRSTLSQIARLCRERGTRCVFLTQPTMWQDPMPADLEALTWFLPIGDTGRTISSPDLARAMTAFNDAMLEMCAQESTECFDLARALPKDSSVFYDEEHFTELGADMVSRAVAEYLLGRL